MGTLLRRLRYLLRLRQHEADLAEELEAHRVMAQAALEQNGAERDEAAFAARRALGNELAARTRARDIWIWPWLQDITQDVRFAARLLLKNPGFTTTAILALGIGSGVNGAMFALFNAYCIAGVPVEQPEGVIYISTRDLRAQERGLSYADFEDLRRASSATMSSLAAFVGSSVSLGDAGRTPDRVYRMHISATAFALMGVGPVLGRDFRTDDDRVGAPATVILSSQVWRSRYAADASILGRTVTLNGVPTTVIGVMPDGFKFPNRAEVWQPLALMTDATGQPRDARTLGAFARLADGASVAQAERELGVVAASLADVYPATNAGIHLTAEPINWQYNADITHPAWIAFVTVGILIVLIACANVANLLLTRSVTRSREIAIRSSLGASRRRVVRQLLVESALLASLGALLGLGIAKAGLLAMTALTPETGIPYFGFPLDGFVLAVFVGLSCLTVFVFGMAPALMVSKTDVNRVLKDGGRGTSGPGTRRWTATFLTAELAITVLLLLKLVGSYGNDAAVRRADELIDSSPVLTAWLTLPAERYGTVASRVAFHQRLSERLASIGEISSLALASGLPRGGASSQQMEIEGTPAADGSVLPGVRTLTVDAGYFESLGLSVLRGRGFDDRDGGPGYEDAIVNQRFVELYSPSNDPIGRRFRLKRDAAATPSAWMTIVGVAPTVRQRAVSEMEPIVYLPFRGMAPATVALIVRTTADSASLATRLREEVRALDADLPLYRVMTLEQAIAETDWTSRVSILILSTVTLVALGLCALGLYAVIAHAVTQRIAEIGVRMALGATAGQVRGLVWRRAAWQTAVGLVVGVTISVVWDAYIFVLGDDNAVPGEDPATVASVALIVCAVTLLASAIPVRRATRVDPINALRHE